MSPLLSSYPNMNVVFIFISSLFFLWVIRELFFWLTVWQTNGYRPDRFFVYLKKRTHKAYSFLSFFFILKCLLFFGFAFVVFDDDLLLYYQYGIIFLYLIQAFIIGKEIYSNHLKKPFLTIRANLIIALTLLSVFIFFAFPLMDKFFWLLLIDLLIPFFVSFFVFVLLFPIEIYTDWQAEKALKKLRARRNLVVIGVTGSHGKSAVKDYIAAVLSYKFAVVKTEGKDNTAGGIARTILKKIDNTTQVFVAELSAYRQGEILLLCQFIHPKIGVLTGINNQYLSLFKGLENIKRTNYELVEGLQKNGICLFNGTNKNTLQLYKKSKKQKILYSLSTNKSVEEKETKGNIRAFNVSKKQKNTSFAIQIDNTVMHLAISSSHNIEQLLPALYIAHHLGMKEREIKKAIAEVY